VLLLTLLGGALVGFSLGLTGGGGAIFALPLLVYLLDVPAREAVGISLLTVGTTSLIGFLERAARGMVEIPTGLLFAAAGMVGAPAGAWLAGQIAEAALLSLFAILMLIVAARMWRTAADSAGRLPAVESDDAGPACRRDPAGRLRLTSRCALLLAVVGLGAGVLAGLFGVGGGFIIVPALVFFSRLPIDRAIGTSLLVITLLSASGTAAHLLSGQDLNLATAAIFTAGSVAGLFAGSRLARRLAGPALQRVFAAAIVGVALYVIFRTVSH
jgi:uncharacterized membrane protein YfcA